MSKRVHQPDTEADLQLYECLKSSPPKSFFMIAGAGSGKTTSLVKGLDAVLNAHGERLRKRRQKVACITYTEVAAKEIWADVGNNELVHVSTIHSFLWGLVKSFQSDIKNWAAKRLEEKIDDLEEKAANFGPRVQQRTREKNAKDVERYKQQQLKLEEENHFSYGTGSDYARGILGHDDVLRMVPEFIEQKKLIRTLVAQQFPFLFVDESQDTTENVVAALKAIDAHVTNGFCLGFFGDPMQRIYATGIGNISPEPGWVDITKRENFRCPASVLSVANAIRRHGDGLQQTRGRMELVEGVHSSVEGSAHLFILPADAQRQTRLGQVSRWVADETQDSAWSDIENPESVRLLVIVHRMAAKRLGFADLYAALNDSAPRRISEGFLDGTAWPLRPFLSFVLPLAEALRTGDEFAAIQHLRRTSSLLHRDNLRGTDVSAKLAELRTFTSNLNEMMADVSDHTILDVLNLINESRVIELNPKLSSYLDGDPSTIQDSDVEEDGETLTKEIATMDSFLSCPAKQMWGYYRYLNGHSPFATQQGIKGAEFDRVLVVLDDEEGTQRQFSYEKYLGIKDLSDTDVKNIKEGKDSTIDRTRRLFYVCCTRALNDLVVVLFTEDTSYARSRIEALDLFPAASILTEEALSDYN